MQKKGVPFAQTRDTEKRSLWESTPDMPKATPPILYIAHQN